MTDWVPTVGDYVRPHRSPWGGFPIRTMPLSTGISSNAIFVGQMVSLDLNSTAFNNCIVPSSLTSNTVVSTRNVGFAADCSTTPSNANNIAQGTAWPVWDANPNVEFRARTRNGLLNSTLVGEAHSLLWDSTLHIHYVNVGASSATTPVNVIITGLIDASGDSGGLVTFSVPAHDITSSLSTANILAFYR